LDLANEIGYVDNPGFSNDGNFNIEKSKRSGVNITSDFALSQSMDLSISASYINAKATSGAQAGKRIPLISQKSSWTSLTKQFGTNWRAQISWLYESDKVLGSDWNNEAGRISSQSKTDFFLKREFGDTEIKLGITNLFDQSFYSYGVRGFSTINSVSGYYDFFVPADPRSFEISVQIAF
jgi:outer membrane receptor protein involved in Fe transport